MDKWMLDLGMLATKNRAIDLSYPMKVGDPIFPGQQGFTFEKLGDVTNPQLPLYFGCVSFMEHCGTHMDAPAHAVAEAPYLDQIPVEQFIGPAVKLDLTRQCDSNRDYDVSVGEIQAFERSHGPIEPGSIVCLHTGWDARYSQPEDYVIASSDGSFHWPGLSGEAAELLVSRGIRGVAIDTIGLDGGHVAMSLAAHRSVLGSAAFILENVANLSRLPDLGAVLVALPMKIHNGSGAPTRVLALI